MRSKQQKQVQLPVLHKTLHQQRENKNLQKEHTKTVSDNQKVLSNVKEPVTSIPHHLSNRKQKMVTELMRTLKNLKEKYGKIFTSE